MALRLATLLLAAAAAHAQISVFSTFFGGSEGEFASGVGTDALGNVYIAGQTGSPDLPVTAGAFQSRYAGGSDAFVAKYSPTGALLWATYYGGSGGDGARGISVDPSGNAIIAGITSSEDLATVNGVSTHLDNGHLQYGLDALVARFDTNGRVVYATYLGGNCNDFAWAVAADSQGNAYVTGDMCSQDFPAANGTTVGTPSRFTGAIFVTKLDPTGAIVYTKLLDLGSPRGIAVDNAGRVYLTGNTSLNGSSAHAYVARLAADGSDLEYVKTFGGSLYDVGLAVTVDPTGAAYVAGEAQSADFPLVNPLQPNFGARVLFSSRDSSASWSVVENPPFGAISAVVSAPAAHTIFVAAYDGGVFKSPDGGATWLPASNGIDPRSIQALAIDPTDPNVLYASNVNTYGNFQGNLYKTTDGGDHWQVIDTQFVNQIVVDPNSPSTVYTHGNGFRKSTDGGATWSPFVIPVDTAPYQSDIQSLTLDPNSPGVIYVPYSLFFGIFSGGRSGVYFTADNGATWKDLDIFANHMLVDSSHKPSTIYADLNYRSDDGGLTWTRLQPPANTSLSLAAIDPATGALIAIESYPAIGIYISNDRGATWQPAASPVSGSRDTSPGIANLIAGPEPGSLYAWTTNTQTESFVAKLSPDGSQLVSSTFLGGHLSLDPAQNTGGGGLMPPAVMLGPNIALGIALDPSGNIAVTGATRSTDFPAGKSNSGQFDVFLSLISPDGGSLLWSTYIGGGLNELARGIAVDPQGNFVIAGQTHSGDFPSVNPAQPAKGNVDDAFVARIAPPAPPN